MPKTQISCPNCRQPIAVELDQLVDVGVDPSLKQKMLAGAINFINCPNCGYQGMASTPLVYHDPDKELLLTFVPSELGLPRDEQERIIGRLINQIVNHLPQEKRKGYLLRPQQTLTIQGLIERVLEGEGITKEMIEAQQKRIGLIQRLVDAKPDVIAEIAVQEDALMDAEFFLLIRRLAEAAMMSNERETAEKLANLQRALIPITTYGKEAQIKAREVEAAVKDLQEAGENLTREQLLELVISAPNEIRLQALASLARPGMDYAFFQLLSEKIDRSRGDGRNRLVEIREDLLEIISQIDREQEERRIDAQKLIERIISSQNIEEAVMQTIPQIDDFFAVELNKAIESARQSGDLEKIGKLQQIVAVIQEANKQPPEIELIEELLSAESPEQMGLLLEENKESITPEFLEILSGLTNQMQNENEPEVLQRLTTLNRMAVRYSMSRNLRT
jgi:hypothetical protein